MKNSVKKRDTQRAWPRNYELVLQVYGCTSDFPQAELFGLKQEMRKTCISIISNLADGSSRNQVEAMLKCFGTAKACLFRLESQITIAHKLGLLTNGQYITLNNRVNAALQELTVITNNSRDTHDKEDK